MVILPILGAIDDYSHPKYQMLALIAYIGSFATIGVLFLQGKRHSRLYSSQLYKRRAPRLASVHMLATQNRRVLVSRLKSNDFRPHDPVLRRGERRT